MFLPVTTDAEVRHWPIATVSMIGFHVLIYIIQCALPPIPIATTVNAADPAPYNNPLADAILNRSQDDKTLPGWWPYALSHGDGLHPLQWMTSFLIHLNVTHLLGNMVFLWVFGLLVEGFSGPWWFLALYIGIGVIENAFEQMIFLAIPSGPSLGASSAIFGLIMIAALWAPQDHVQCFYFLIWFVGFVNVPTLIMGAVYFLFEFTMAIVSSFQLGTSLWHLMGAVLGLIAGFVMLKSDWVDCDDRDVLSMIQGDKPKTLSRRKRRKAVAEQQQARLDVENRIEIGWKSFDMHLGAGNLNAALKQLTQLQRHEKTLQWTEPRLWQLICGFLKSQDFDQAYRFAEIYQQRFTERVDSIHLLMAQIVGLKRGRRRAA